MAEVTLKDLLDNCFSEDGVKAEFTLEEWLGGWVKIVGGVNGVPTAQQFNQLGYVFSYWLKSLASDLSTIKTTANDALPEAKFTAKEIIGLLAAYGLMKDCNADLLDGKHADEFANSSHTHTKNQISDFPSALKNPNAITVKINGKEVATYDGSSVQTINITVDGIGAMPLAGGTFAGKVSFGSKDKYFVDTDGNAQFNTVVGAVYND